jgi:hypothetical protein
VRGDLRETILASLRVDLANEWDGGMLILDAALVDRRGILAAEHALDAAVARCNASVAEVIEAAVIERRRRGDPLPGDTPDLIETLRRAGDLPAAAAALRGMALHALSSLHSVLASAGHQAILDEFEHRCHERGLPRDQAMLGEVLGDDEMRDIYVGGMA